MLETRQLCLQSDRKEDLLFFASDQSLSYLDGTLPADYGFDPLGLSDPEGAGGFIDPDWLRYSEVIHARWWASHVIAICQTSRCVEAVGLTCLLVMTHTT